MKPLKKNIAHPLEEALQQAIKDENYELAAQIRDQINARNKKQQL